MLLPYIVLAAILLNGAETVSEQKTLKNYTILYMYITQGQGQITPGDKILTVTKIFYNISPIQMYDGTNLTLP